MDYLEKFEKLCKENGFELDDPETVKAKLKRAVAERERYIEATFPRKPKGEVVGVSQ